MRRRHEVHHLIVQVNELINCLYDNPARENKKLTVLLSQWALVYGGNELGSLLAGI